MPYRFLRKISNSMAEVSTPDGHTIRLPYSGSLPKPGSVITPDINKCCNPTGFTGYGSNKKLASNHPQPRRVSSGESKDVNSSMLILKIQPEPGVDLAKVSDVDLSPDNVYVEIDASNISGDYYVAVGSGDYFLVTEGIYKLRFNKGVTSSPISHPLKFTELKLSRIYVLSMGHSFPTAFHYAPPVDNDQLYPKRDLYILETNPFVWGRDAQTRFLNYYRLFFPVSNMFYLKQGQPGLQPNGFDPEDTNLNYYEVPDFTRPIHKYEFEPYDIKQ